MVLSAERLLEVHRAVNPRGPGRRDLQHVTHSGVVMLCAAWELYLEQVLVESVEYICESSLEANDLPVAVRKQLVIYSNEGKDELSSLMLCGDGWKQLYRKGAESTIGRLNTPKSTPVDQMFRSNLGIQNLSDFWGSQRYPIDEFVSTRGEIAHRGRDAPYVKAKELQQFITLVKKSVIQTDNGLCDYLRKIAAGTRQPWNKKG